VLDALREPRFRRLWLAGLCINAARWMDFLVLGWLALELTDSPFLVAVAAFCRAAPMLAFGFPAGVLADRLDRGRVMVAVQCLNLGTTAFLALLFGAGLGSYGALVGLAVLLGTGWAIDFPARRTALYTLVGPARLTNAVSLESVSMQASKALGPVLGGVLLASAGASGCYAALAALYAVALVLLAGLGRHVAFPPAVAGEPVLASLAAGLREVRAQPMIRAVLLVTVLMNTLVFPYQHMLPVFAREILGIGPARLGLLVAADGLGALTGALAIAGWRGLAVHGVVFAGGSLAAAALVVAFAFSPWYALSLPLQVAIGMAESGFGTMQSAIVLLAAPDRARGRAMGILSACIGTQLFGTLWIGFLTSLVGAPVAAATGATVAALLMLPVASRMATRHPGPA
jgi:MFS family permease